ncbi:MAG: LysR family transcriptional regulator [Myxococcota bacterium]
MTRDGAPLHGLDLNLLVTLRALLQAEGVSAAAARLGQTQPTVSRALAVLRTAFDDPLLVRSGRLMVRTPTADALLPRLERILAAVGSLEHAGTFDPATSDREFRLIMPSMAEPVLLPRLVEHLRDKAPRVNLQVGSTQADPLARVLAGAVDVALGRRLDHAEVRARVMRPGLPSFVTLIGKEHPAYGSTLTEELWLASDHVMLRVEGGDSRGSSVDRMLAERGLERRIAVQASGMATVLELVERQPFVFSFSATLVEPLVRERAIEVHDTPLALDLTGLQLAMCWHESNHADPANRWFRQVVAESLSF